MLINGETKMSLIKQAIGRVSIERLYNHILALEGIRHPIDSYETLIQAENYIETNFKQSNLETEKHSFSINGLEKSFSNVIGFLHQETKNNDSITRIIISSHFDTVFRSPGADDNASAIAVMLEVARILKEVNYEKHVQFISFNLEEGSPIIQQKIRDIGNQLKVYDRSYRYTSWILKKYVDEFWKRIRYSGPGQYFLDEAKWDEFKIVAMKELGGNELKFLEEVNHYYRQLDMEDMPTMGSLAYAQYASEKMMDIKGVLNLESIGYTSSKPHSQTFPPGLNLDAFETFNVDTESMKGNFIAIISDDKSTPIAKSFFRNSQHPMIELPCVNVSVPLTYHQIIEMMPDLLRSDHGPFWKYGFPAIMLTDTANFRNPYYHTAADTITTLDFEFIKKITQAVLATIFSSDF